MYRLEDRPAAIREVQRFLLIVSQNDLSIPHITVDGVYTEQTAEAVRIFQQSRNIIPTGSVDLETFTLLFGEASELMAEEERRRRVIDAEGFPLKLGDSGSDVNGLNTILRELSEYYNKIIVKPYGSFFSRDTYDAVIIMQKQLLEEESGLVSIKFYDKLSEELNARKKFNII